MTDRASCWSITINNPSDADVKVELPAKWKLEGQYEEGAEGTRHFQGMLTTPQVRFSAVKKVFPRSHIEVARNKKALEQYVKKEETRVGEFETKVSEIPSWYEYSNELAKRFDLDEYNQKTRELQAKDIFDYETYGNLRLKMIDAMIEEDIESGRKGIEWIGVNPNFRQAWKRYGVALARREQRSDDPPDQDDQIDRS